jgi:thiol-disulfide isomerase/thioredoxin
MIIANLTSYEQLIGYIDKYKKIIINISAPWCKPCLAIKPQIEKFVSVIDTSEIIYLKIDYDSYQEDNNLESIFNVKKIPYFAFLQDNSVKDSFVSGDFSFVSKKIFNFIQTTEKVENELTNNIENFKINDDF